MQRLVPVQPIQTFNVFPLKIEKERNQIKEMLKSSRMKQINKEEIKLKICGSPAISNTRVNVALRATGP